MQSFLSARRQIVVVENPVGRTLQIVELTGFHRPDKGRKASQAESKRQGNENHENVHAAFPALRAFKVTMIDEPDIASAAISGVA